MNWDETSLLNELVVAVSYTFGLPTLERRSGSVWTSKIQINMDLGKTVYTVNFTTSQRMCYRIKNAS